jgi:DNA repair photolyase
VCEHQFVRWSNLDAREAEQATLPGYRDAVVRHFDAPQALDTRFYEVHAKSALNRVPKASRVPFRWTINPYRGCSHACVYCHGPKTPILLADGRTKSIAALRAGEAIIGTELDGPYRRYVETKVLDHWMVWKPAYTVHLEDGTRLVTSGDHRFLTERGWKHVAPLDRRLGQRPHLTTNNALLGTGGFAQPPEHCADYRRGYLCGLIRGDGHLSSRPYTPRGRNQTTIHRFRLALTDFEALRRAKEYLLAVDVEIHEYEFKVAAGPHRPMRSLASGAAVTVARVRELAEWPVREPSRQWRKGFLAGIFDAEGSASGTSPIRIANKDSFIIHWTRSCLEHFGFDTVVDGPKPNGCRYVRIRGGLKERLRFFHLTDPAITRKRTVQGTALKSDARTRVVAIEQIGMDLPLVDITTGTGDFIADGVVSHNCFARPTHTYLGFDAGRDFEKEIVVKVNVPEVLRAELRRPSWAREHVAMGTNTDPYQWVEGRYRLMPGIWAALRDARTPASVLTKSPLLLRDLDLMVELGAVAEVSANLSVPTLDEKAWRATEPHTPHPRARLEAVAELNRAGIPTGVLAAPLMPGINDAPEQVEALLAAADEAGAVGIGGIALHLRGETRGVFMDWLRSARPDLVPRYEKLYARGAYAPPAERRRLAGLVRRPGSSSPSRLDSGEERGASAASPRPKPIQERLF